MYIRRLIEEILPRYSRFPVVALLGPRQSGKTTLSKHFFKQHLYVSLEDPAIRELAMEDAKGFLRKYDNAHGLIIDEFQYAPQILSYIQLEVDEKDRPGYFVLTGSQNFLVNERITQSLAGRVGIITLLPLSIHELSAAGLLNTHASDLIIKGGYPRIYAQHIEPQDLYPSYINTYVERDVRQLVQVTDLTVFQKFLALCAGRVGQLFNATELAMNCGISAPTANKWLSILEASYILFRLQPYFVNYNKRVIKTPKLYFYDTGLVCNLLQIHDPAVLAVSPFRGALFENFIISDLYKQFCNKGQRPPLYFWRNTNGLVEVDCLIDKGVGIIPIEIKAAETISSAFFSGITKFNEISTTEPEKNIIVYAGADAQARRNGTVMGWQASGDLVDKII
jgi:predicted AAA+ superfamily ATPase